MSGSAIAVRRAFLALWPPAEAAAILCQRAATHCPDLQARTLAAADLHCTLCFIGDLDEATLTVIGELMDGIDADAVAMQIDRLEWWPGPAVLVACPSPPSPAALVTLQARVVAVLPATVAPVPSSGFRPHVTVRRGQRRGCSTKRIEPVECRFSDFVLAGSADAASPGRYRILRRWPLAAGTR